MQGASPLASPGLNPGGTGAGAAYRALAGGLPRRCRLTLPSLSPTGVRRLGMPPCPAFSLLCCPPSPRPPSPVGKGEDSRLFHARGFAPCIPAPKPGRHRNRGGISRAGRGLAPALPADLAVSVPSGGRRFGLPPYPAFSFPSCPPSPQPPSPPGKGEIQGYFMRGASPLASPGLNPGGTGTGAAYHALARSLPRRCRMTLPSLSPAGGGGWGCRPTLPLVLILPPSPSPLPRWGRGRFKVISCKGLRPLHPQGWTGRSTGCPCRTGTSAGGGITRRERFLSVLRRPIGSAAGVPGAKPPAKSTKNLPLPAGKGGRGDGGKIKAKGRAERQPQPPSPPAGYHSDKVSQCRKRSNPGDARGEAPCIRKL